MVDFADRIRELAGRIPAQIEHIASEEATKNALVLPFISALGYNVFDSREVTPELTADVGTKKGEKVDYAILQDGQPILLFECKPAGTNLDHAHTSQLYRYFSVVPARFGVLTNGTTYRFFSDLDSPNKMDTRPFFEVDLLRLEEPQIAQLAKFAKSRFDLEGILETASDLKYTGEIKKVLGSEMAEPSDELVRFFASRVYSGRLTQAVRDQFQEITRRALQEFVSDRVRERLTSALKEEVRSGDERARDSATTPREGGSHHGGVVTTVEEREGFYVVRAILAEIIDPERVAMRDVLSYCGVLLDDNNRKPICRLHFNSAQKYVGLFDEEKNERREPIDSVSGLYRFAKELREAVRRYDEEA